MKFRVSCIRVLAAIIVVCVFSCINKVCYFFVYVFSCTNKFIYFFVYVFSCINIYFYFLKRKLLKVMGTRKRMHH